MSLKINNAAIAQFKRCIGKQNQNPLDHREEDGTLVSDLPGDHTALLTLDAPLQRAMEAYFERYEVPYAGLVAIEPSTGRVLAYVSHSSASDDAGDMARDANAPAASVFKIITASAALEEGIVTPSQIIDCGAGSIEASATMKSSTKKPALEADEASL